MITYRTWHDGFKNVSDDSKCDIYEKQMFADWKTSRRWPRWCRKCFFWPAAIMKKLEHFRCIHVLDLVLKYVSDINERIGIQLLFYFVFLVIIIASFIRVCFFHLWLRFLGWGFLALQCHGNVCNRIPKLIWPRLGYFWRFFRICLVLSFSYLHGLKSAGIAQMIFFFHDIKSFW